MVPYASVYASEAFPCAALYGPLQCRLMAELLWRDTVLRNWCRLEMHDECTGKHWVLVSKDDGITWHLDETWPCTCECHGLSLAPAVRDD